MQGEICQGKKKPIKLSARSFISDLLETQTYHHRFWQSKQTFSSVNKPLTCVNWQSVLLLIQHNFLSCLACLLGIMKHKSSLSFFEKRKRAYLLIVTTHKIKKTGTYQSLAKAGSSGLWKAGVEISQPRCSPDANMQTSTQGNHSPIVLTCHCLVGDGSFSASLDLDQMPSVQHHLGINGISEQLTCLVEEKKKNLQKQGYGSVLLNFKLTIFLDPI